MEYGERNERVNVWNMGKGMRVNVWRVGEGMRGLMCRGWGKE